MLPKYFAVSRSLLRRHDDKVKAMRLDDLDARSPLQSRTANGNFPVGDPPWSLDFSNGKYPNS